MTYTTPPNPEPEQPVKSRRTWRLWIVGGVALLVGFGSGALAAQDGLPETPSGAPETRTVTETVQVPAEIPAECLAALDDADGLIDLASEFASITAEVMGLARDGVLAASTFDVGGMEESTAGLLAASDEIDAVTAQVDQSTYAMNRDVCRAAVR